MSLIEKGLINNNNPFAIIKAMWKEIKNGLAGVHAPGGKRQLPNCTDERWQRWH